jgi:GPI mannosyltransferase 4
MVSMCAIILDSVYFRTLVVSIHGLPLQPVQFFRVFAPWNWTQMSVGGSMSITPWNNYMYNSRHENLAEHGIHPWFTHIAVNVPLLVGPIALYMLQATCSRSWISDMQKVVVFHDRHMTSFLQSSQHVHSWPVVLLLTCLVVVPLVILSQFMHQEPRFLLPLVLPICILFAPRLYGGRWRRLFVALWVISNLLLSVTFGVLHQGGLLRAVLAVQSAVHTPQLQVELGTDTAQMVVHHRVDVFFHQTYMIPRAMLAHTRDNSNVELFVHETSGTPAHLAEQLVDNVNNHRYSIEQKSRRSTWDAHDVYLVVPASVPLSMSKFRTFPAVLELSQSFCPHLSTEWLPTGISATEKAKQLCMLMYRVRQRSDR